MEQTPGYRVTASSGGMTTPSTTVAGMSGYVAPPPGLTLPDFSGWRLPPPEAPHPGDYPPLHQASLPTTTWVTGNAVPAGEQLPKKSMGRGVASNPSADKTAPTGGASSQDCRRPTTRGWGDGGRSVSHPRGTQGKVSAQPLCQEGDLPSGSTPSVPPSAAPEGTQPQHGGQPRSALRDPA